ncbi:hypothetical protein PsorP6_010324 [Peronosclerospora sorghi]|uniref:Uncharacterized protein n=1 Tax=Peronosclerospora sorghi TaxID=230839 RepID=A0ACC0VVA1_9STRA|nr:hypothetical protein PsorP6_010324 [Peronosclerospora sorghi]
MSFSSFYSVVNAIKDKSAEAMTTLSADLEDFKTIVQEDVAELSKTMRQNLQERRQSGERRCEFDESGTKDQDEAQERDVDPASTKTEAAAADEDVDPLTSLKNSLFSFTMSPSLNSVGTTVQGSLHSVQDSLTSVGSKLTSLNVGASLESLEAMGSKLLNSADELLGTLAGDTVEGEDDDGVSEEELRARRCRLVALQEDATTYIEPPRELEPFETWKRGISMDDVAALQKEVVEMYPTVGTKFTELVPSMVDAQTFWMHYLYKASHLIAERGNGQGTSSPKAIEETGKPVFLEDESKDEEKASSGGAVHGPTSSSDGESWIELDEQRKETTAKDSSSGRTDLKVEEGDEAVDEDSLDWGDDDHLALPEATPAVTSDLKTPHVTPEEASQRGEDWGEWD